VSGPGHDLADQDGAAADCSCRQTLTRARAGWRITLDRVTGPDGFRLTQYARGGGCACKIPPGELEETIARLVPDGPGTDLLVGVEHGDDGAVVRVGPALAVVVTADFFTPVVDDAYTFGRIAATNALSDIYAMGGEPLVAVNLLGWPRGKLPAELAAEVLRAAAPTWAGRRIVTWRAGTASTTRSRSTGWR
jgi:selenophosphate synthase